MSKKDLSHLLGELLRYRAPSFAEVKAHQGQGLFGGWLLSPGTNGMGVKFVLLRADPDHGQVVLAEPSGEPEQYSAEVSSYLVPADLDRVTLSYPVHLTGCPAGWPEVE